MKSIRLGSSRAGLEKPDKINDLMLIFDSGGSIYSADTINCINIIINTGLSTPSTTTG